MSHDLPRTRTDITAAQAEVDRQLAPLLRKRELLQQWAEIQEEWDRLDGDMPAAPAGIVDTGTKNGVPVKMSQRAKIILQEKPGQYIILREIWQAAVDRGWIEPTRESRSAMRVALRRLVARDDSIESVEQPPTHAYRWLPPSTAEPSRNGAGHAPWESGVSMR